ncbi:hypothetical protein LSH36_245g00000 [Paralvinella palmiformis]|uniref:Uncharacterized protein n=1 Tax=Paralvinella palmiformis TaxID=53620 RepID=A0AAD9N500_9ANNE|nr:hypothetical protein LSH36_245g00000 [Paralvinella palmiformis]
MGNWQLETFKMFNYMLFPLTCFWVFNQPEVIEAYMLEQKLEEILPERLSYRVHILKVIDKIQKETEERMHEEFRRNFEM